MQRDRDSQEQFKNIFHKTFCRLFQKADQSANFKIAEQESDLRWKQAAAERDE